MGEWSGGEVVEARKARGGKGGERREKWLQWVKADGRPEYSCGDGWYAGQLLPDGLAQSAAMAGYRSQVVERPVACRRCACA